MKNPYESFTTRHELRQTLLETEHRKRVFDFAGNSVKELDAYRGTILELLDALDNSDDQRKALSTSYERRQANLKNENVMLRDAIADFHRNTPSTPPLLTTESLDDLPISGRVKGLLRSVAFNTARDFSAFNIHDFTNIHGFGVNALTDANQALFRRGLPPIPPDYPENPYTYVEPRILREPDDSVEELHLHPHVEFMLKTRGKNTVRSVLLTPRNELHKIFHFRGRASSYLWDALTLISFPGRILPAAIASEYGNMDVLYCSPACLRLSSYTLNILTEKGILTIGDLLAHSRDSLRELTGFTFITIAPIQTQLKARNLRLRRRGKEVL